MFYSQLQRANAIASAAQEAEQYGREFTQKAATKVASILEEMLLDLPEVEQDWTVRATWNEVVAELYLVDEELSDLEPHHIAFHLEVARQAALAMIENQPLDELPADLYDTYYHGADLDVVYDY